MRFGDVQDTRKKEDKKEIKERTLQRLERQMRKMMPSNVGRRLATVNGVTIAL